MAVTAIVPPMAWKEELLADDAVINSRPADVMRQFGRSAVIACNVSSRPALRAEGVEGPDADALLRWSGRSDHRRRAAETLGSFCCTAAPQTAGCTANGKPSVFAHPARRQLWRLVPCPPTKPPCATPAS